MCGAILWSSKYQPGSDSAHPVNAGTASLEGNSPGAVWAHVRRIMKELGKLKLSAKHPTHLERRQRNKRFLRAAPV